MPTTSTDMFFIRALAVLKVYAHVGKDVKDIFNRDVLRAFDAWGGNDYLSTFDEMEEAIDAFEIWVEDWDGQYPQACKPVLLEMTFTAPLGRGTISISLHGALPDAATQETINKAAVQLWDNITASYKHMADRRGANGVSPTASAIDHQTAPLPETVPTNNTGIAPAHVTVEITKVSIEMKDGKPLWKLHGGQWEKYGVRVWPEVLEKAGVIHKGRTKGGTVKGWKATVLVTTDKDGKQKPSKVVDLVISPSQK